MVQDMKSLIAKLDKNCRLALELAAQKCVSQTHFSVELEHFLFQLLTDDHGELPAILRAYGLNPEAVISELTAAMEGFKRGNGRVPTISPQLLQTLEAGWLLASVQFGVLTVRAGILLLAILDDNALRHIAIDSCPTLLKISRDRLRQDLPELLRAASQPVTPADKPEPSVPTEETVKSDGALSKFTIDLTAQARAGKIDPISGRDGEIRQVVDILMRRRQNNPILTGEAGVGKTAVVEGLALRIAANDVPEPLKNIAIRVLDLGLLQAGAGVKGEFENRLKSVISEVAASLQPIILFIDEAHTLIGAGGQAGQGDAANLLKPALARGELRTIAATTWAEYKKYFEKDAALARRFQVVKVAEPDEETAEIMLRGLASKLEQHHRVRVLDEAISAAVRLSHRYITGRQLPDKAISVLDTACARVAVSQVSPPPALEAAIRRVDQLGNELAVLERESRRGYDHSERMALLSTERTAAEEERSALTQRWEQEKALVSDIQALSRSLEEGASIDRPHLEKQRQDLAALQETSPMVPVCVDQTAVTEVISAWTGIPVGKMVRDDIQAVLSLENRLGERLIGQDQALSAIARRIRTYRADMAEPGKPVGVFLLVGPSGVGKTETANGLADLLYGGESNQVVINMSEYQEAHTVASLKGSPPGYVGYGTGGVLTEAVRRNPYTVVLLDEVEKAHPDVMDLFYQVFDKGILEDGEGVEVNFRNTLILLTSNLGSEQILELCANGSHPPVETVIAALRPQLLQRFKAALLARMAIVPYYPLEPQVLRRIVALKLDKITQRLRERYSADLLFDTGLVERIVERCAQIDNGARDIDHILTDSLLPELSARILDHMARDQSFSRITVTVTVTVGDDGGFAYQFDL